MHIVKMIKQYQWNMRIIIKYYEHFFPYFMTNRRSSNIINNITKLRLCNSPSCLVKRIFANESESQKVNKSFDSCNNLIQLIENSALSRYFGFRQWRHDLMEKGVYHFRTTFQKSSYKKGLEQRCPTHSPLATCG